MHASVRRRLLSTILLPDVVPMKRAGFDNQMYPRKRAVRHNTTNVLRKDLTM